MKCNKCGTELPDNTVRCPICHKSTSNGKAIALAASIIAATVLICSVILLTTVTVYRNKKADSGSGQGTYSEVMSTESYSENDEAEQVNGENLTTGGEKYTSDDKKEYTELTTEKHTERHTERHTEQGNQPSSSSAQIKLSDSDLTYMRTVISATDGYYEFSDASQLSTADTVGIILSMLDISYNYYDTKDYIDYEADTLMGTYYYIVDRPVFQEAAEQILRPITDGEIFSNELYAGDYVEYDVCYTVPNNGRGGYGSVSINSTAVNGDTVTVYCTVNRYGTPESSLNRIPTDQQHCTAVFRKNSSSKYPYKLLSFDKDTASEAPKPEVTTTAEHDVYDIRQGGYFIVKNTPASAGLVKRGSPKSTSESYGTLKEGSVVKARYDYTSLDGGYACVYKDDFDDCFFVLAKYLYPYNPYESSSDSYKDLQQGMKARVCFNTPKNAGLNLRSGPGSTYELECTVSEGAVVDILNSYSSSDGDYIKVGYDHPHAGEYYEGWVLAQYLEYYGE